MSVTRASTIESTVTESTVTESTVTESTVSGSDTEPVDTTPSRIDLDGPAPRRRFRFELPSRRTVWGYVPALLIVVGAVAAWEAWVRIGDVPNYVLPAPSRIAVALWASRTTLVAHTATTASEAIVGLLLGGIAGFGLALAMSASRTLMRGLAPLLVVSQTIPIIVLAPLLVLWFGFGIAPKVIVVALMAFFPVAIASLGGLMSVDPQQIEMLHSMGARRSERMRYLQIPHAIPSAINGLRVSAAYAVGGAVVGEWTGATSGLGVFISRARKSFRIDQVFAGVVVVAVLSIVLFGAVDMLGRFAAPWFYRRRRALGARSPLAST